MKIPAKLTAATAAMTLGLASAALASGTTTTGTAPNPNAKAYGRLCQSESKKHVAGEKGTDFSRCVTDMAHAAHSSQSTTGSQSTTNPTSACANEPKKHHAGEKGTPFSLCVSAAAKLLGQLSNQNGS